MAKPNSSIPWSIITVVALSLFAGCLICSCDSSSGSSDNDGSGNNATAFTAPLNDDFKNIPLNEGENQEIVFTYTISNDLSAKDRLSLDLSKTLANSYLSAGPTASAPGKVEMIKMLANLIIKNAFAAEQGQIMVHISHGDDPDVCDSPFVYGPYDLSGDIDTALSSTTARVSPNQATKDIINSGSLELCVKTTPPADAYLTVPSVVVEYEDCEASEFNIVGFWEGYYECAEFDEPQGEPDTPISLSISHIEDERYQFIDNNTETLYEGYLCGNELKFEGGYEGNTSESGTIVFESNTSANSTSIYINLSETERLRCSNTLNKTLESDL